MKTEEEILEDIESLKKSRDVYVVGMVDWIKFNFAVKKLEWVLEE